VSSAALVKNQLICVNVPCQPNSAVNTPIGNAHSAAPITASMASFVQLKRACAGVGVSSSINAAPKDFFAALCPPALNFSGASRPPK
jgi:hypothetical protein